MAPNAPQLGLSLVPNAADVDRLRASVKLADEGGLDLVGIQDHPYQRRFVDTFALLSDLLARTRHVRVFPDVANLPLRPPAVLAKQAATLDLLSGGRFEVGLGAGGFREAIVAMGGPERSPGESVDALSEAIDIIRLVWSDERTVRYEGEHYRLDGLHPGPPPAHAIGIWLGAYKPRMLRLTGEKADGWVPSLMRGVTPEHLGELGERVTEAAQAAGRAPGEIRRIWNVPTPVAAGDELRLAEQLADWAERHGPDTFIIWPDEADVEAQVERLAGVVAPAVREALGAAPR